jgi:hypothetical protein
MSVTNKPLWSDKNPYDPMTCETYEEARAMYNLYEDIQCLKEELEAANEIIKPLAKKDIISQRECYQRGFSAGSKSMRDKAVHAIKSEYLGVSEEYEQDGIDLVRKIKELKE